MCICRCSSVIIHFFSVLSFQMIQLFPYSCFWEKKFFFHFYAFQEAVNILAAAHTTIWPSDTPVGVQLSTLDWTLPVMSHFGFGLLEISTNVCRPNNVIDIKNVKNVDNEIELSYGIVLIFWCLKIWAYWRPSVFEIRNSGKR